MWRESRINKAGRLIQSTKALGIDHGRTGKCKGSWATIVCLHPW